VDNNSTDGSTDRLKEYAARDPRIQLICRSENAGFSAANNQAARQARGEYLVFLNADTVVTSGWVERLLRHCRRDSSVGMVVPVTNSAGNQARINVSYTDRQSMEQFALRLARANMDASIELEVGPLFCAMVPRRVWNGVGELDERFAVGMFEDDDFSLRLRQSGFRIVTAEDCFVHHFGQGSFSQLASERYNQVFEENRRRFEAKWNVTWKPHQYREGILPGVTHFAPSSFSKRDAADGAPTY
jgi:GT2 family glycosyltransferase